jgi:hypothetical protein
VSIFYLLFIESISACVELAIFDVGMALGDERPLRIREEIFGDRISTEVGVLEFRVFEVMAESDTLITVHDDDVMFVEDEVVDPHRLRKFVFEGSGCSPGGMPFASNPDWVLVRDD